MVVYFNKKDLVSFGKYLLSDERKQSIKVSDSAIPLEDRLKEVYHSDISNWMEANKKHD